MSIQAETGSLPFEEAVALPPERLQLEDGAETTVHVARFPRAFYIPEIVVMEEPTPLLSWCSQNGYKHGINGGFFIRDTGQPLGELCIKGKPVLSQPFDPDWSHTRGSIHISPEGELSLGPRHVHPGVLQGSLLQAGPSLVHRGHSVFGDNPDDHHYEGFPLTKHQHDQDITADRHPRAAIASDKEYIYFVAADGRSSDEAGLYLHELARFLVEDLEVEEAVNMDGGRSTSLVVHGALRNRPRSSSEYNPEGFGVYNAIVFRQVAA